MGTKICPICDSKVNAISFCPDCKKFVRAKEIPQNVYLNERRTNEYDYTNNVVRQSQTQSTSWTQSQSTSLTRPQPHSQSQPTPQKTVSNKKQNKMTSLLIGVSVVLFWFILQVIMGYNVDFDSDDTDSDYDYDYDYSDDSDDSASDSYYGDFTEMTEAEAIADGSECTYYGHYHDKLMDELIEDVLTAGTDLDIEYYEDDDYVLLGRYDNSDTRYDVTAYIMNLPSNSGYTIYSDYNTQAIHGALIWADCDTENLREYFDTFIEALDDASFATQGSTYASILSSIMDYTEQGMSEDYEYDGYDYDSYSSGNWYIYVGINEDYVFVQMEAK